MKKSCNTLPYERKLISNVLSMWCVHRIGRPAAHMVILGELEGREAYHSRVWDIVPKHVVICGGYIIIVFAYGGNVLLDTSCGRVLLWFCSDLRYYWVFEKKNKSKSKNPWLLGLFFQNFRRIFLPAGYGFLKKIAKS